jgi:hypothetical protein
VSLLLVVDRDALPERARLRARGLIVEGICADNVCRRCSHCFREVVDLDIVDVMSWATAVVWVCAKTGGGIGVGVAAELEQKPRRSELASPLSWRAPPGLRSSVTSSIQFGIIKLITLTL